MKVFTYSEARQNLSKLLALAQKEEVEIRRKDGSVFTLRAKRSRAGSPFDVPGVDTAATTSDILEAVRESRERRGSTD
ncbi:MAG: prevent-host-death protein [Wenzhouxiangellaceae bacterium]|nr:prevent-host-death protein [Wenzhouxiangellaceae bacterium]